MEDLNGVRVGCNVPQTQGNGYEGETFDNPSIARQRAGGGMTEGAIVAGSIKRDAVD